MENKYHKTGNEVYEIVKKHVLVTGPPVVLDVEKSHGSYLHDGLSNTDYLDMATFFGSNPIGFNHRGLLEPEFLERLKKAALVKPCAINVYTVEFANWVETFSRVCGREDFKHYFFIDGGALAVENGLKTAFDWKVRKNIQKGLPSDTNVGVIHFKDAYHGRSGYTLSLTNTSDPRKYQHFPIFDWPRITNPKCKFPLTGKNLEEVIALERKALREIDVALKKKDGQIAAIIAEPIQGDGGDHHFRPEFFQALRKICDENELLLVFDEVQTGIGMTGKMWAFEHFGISPDIVCFCKKTQVGGIMTTERIDDVDNVFKVPSRIGSTFGGNLVDMVRATRFLEIIEEENLVANAARMGAFMTEELNKLASHYPDRIDNIRGLGLFGAFDLPSTPAADEFYKKCFDKKLLVNKCGNNGIRLRPFLDVKKEDIGKMVNIFKEVLDEMA